jgi:hypothetical protein
VAGLAELGRDCAPAAHGEIVAIEPNSQRTLIHLFRITLPFILALREVTVFTSHRKAGGPSLRGEKIGENAVFRLAWKSSELLN